MASTQTGIDKVLQELTDLLGFDAAQEVFARMKQASLHDLVELRESFAPLLSNVR